MIGTYVSRFAYNLYTTEGNKEFIFFKILLCTLLITSWVSIDPKSSSRRTRDDMSADDGNDGGIGNEGGVDDEDDDEEEDDDDGALVLVSVPVLTLSDFLII